MDCSRCGARFGDEAPRCPSCGTEMISASDAIAIRLGDEMTTSGEVVRVEKRREDRVVGRTASARHPLSSGRTEIKDDGSIHIAVSGPVRSGERGTIDVARILVSRLNEMGARWERLQCQQVTAREERGVDCEAWDSQGGHLQIQITRADADNAFYRQQASEGEAGKVYVNVDVMIDTWRRAIHEKTSLAGRSTITLALDAADASQTLPEAIDLFRHRYGTWAGQRGFRDVWIIGANAEWTDRLDSP